VPFGSFNPAIIKIRKRRKNRRKYPHQKRTLTLIFPMEIDEKD
jgi:hypothetical protein